MNLGRVPLIKLCYAFSEPALILTDYAVCGPSPARTTPCAGRVPLVLRRLRAGFRLPFAFSRSPIVPSIACSSCAVSPDRSLPPSAGSSGSFTLPLDVRGRRLGAGPAGGWGTNGPSNVGHRWARAWSPLEESHCGLAEANRIYREHQYARVSCDVTKSNATQRNVT